jgi:hypothetical protein
LSQDDDVNILIIDTIHEHCKKYGGSETVEQFIKKSLQYENTIWSNKKILGKEITSEYHRIIENFIEEGS